VPITSVEPLLAVEGGRLVVRGSFAIGDAMPEVRLGETAARLSFASTRRLVVIVPPELPGGQTPIQIAGVPGETAFADIGTPWATGLHQVDNPVFDAAGSLYVTYSGSRGQESPVSIFRVTRQGTREPFASGIVNATSMTLGPDGDLYVTSRFEGAVYRVKADGTHDAVASDLGVACGVVFDREGWMYVGDRSGTIFRVRGGRATTFATLPASVAAFHLAMSPAGDLYVTAPTLSAYDPVYKIDPEGAVEVLPATFGRPQGLAFDAEGRLHIVEALAGASGVYRVDAGRAPELVVAGSGLVGVAFGPRGEMVVASNETAYRFN
jgi:sugar lactone lactonase YvrE